MSRLFFLVFGVLMFIPHTSAFELYGQLDSGVAQYRDADDVSVTYGGKFGTLVFESENIQLFIEGGYKDLGKMDTDDLDTSNISVESYSLGFKISMLDVGPVELFGALGGQHWKSKSSLVNDDDSDIYWGVSIEFPIDDRIDIGIGYNNFKISNDSISQLELKALYNF